MHKWKYLLAVTVLSLIVTLPLALSSFVTQVNQQISELFASPSDSASSSHLFLEQPRQDATFAESIKSLKQAQAKRIFWLLQDEELQGWQKQILEAYDLHTIKIPSRRFSNDGFIREYEQSHWQPTAGYLTSIKDHLGLSRAIPLASSVSAEEPGQTLPILPSPVATLHSGLLQNKPTTLFIDFSKTSINAPVLSHELLIDSLFLEKMVPGRDVFIMPKLDLLNATVKVPYSHNQPGWHPLQYHASALAAFEAKDFIKPLAAHTIIVLVILANALFVALFLTVAPKLKRAAIYVAVLAVILLTVPVAQLTGYVPPLIELLFASGALVLTTEYFTRRFRLKSINALDGLINREANHFDKATPNDRLFWDNVASMVTQTLELERCIFLEIHGEDHRLMEISATNCSLQDINEQRRDIRREPYAQAVLSKQASICSRPFFKDKPENEIEILMPIYKSTKMLGFWALSTTEADQEKQRHLLEQVNLYGLHISMLLDLQQQTTKGEQKYINAIQQYGCAENLLVHTIGSNLNGLLLNSHAFLSLFSAMSTPAILFDVFGQLYLSNAAMRKMAKSEQLNSIDTTAFEFLSSVLSASADNLKNMIRQLTLERSNQVQRFFINLNGSDYIAVVSSVHHEAEFEIEHNTHLNLHGLMVEFHSLKDIQAFLQIERGLYDNYLIKIKNYLSTLQMGLIQIERKADDPLINQLALYLNLELKKASDATRRTHYFMNRVADREHKNGIPFEPLQILQSQLNYIVKNPNNKPGWRQVQVDVALPKFTTMGLGNPDSFNRLIKAALALLVDDAISPKKVRITGKQLFRNDADILYLKLDSDGYGLPDEQLQRMAEQNAVLGEQTLLSDVLIALKAAKDSNMECRFKSRVGKGYRLSILVEGINLDD